jgi:hypothetical protein
VRHVLTRRPAYLIAAFFVLVVVAFSYFRSVGFGIALGPEPEPVLVSEPGYPWFDEAMEIWDARCYGCHAELTYIPGLFLAEGGREYLIDVMLFGALGEVEIEGVVQTLRHRPYRDEFSDEEHAALLNLMLVAWGNDEALPDDVEFYTAENVAQARERDLSQEQVIERRPTP